MSISTNEYIMKLHSKTFLEISDVVWDSPLSKDQFTLPDSSLNISEFLVQVVIFTYKLMRRYSFVLRRFLILP